jgi:hypothetical protein
VPAKQTQNPEFISQYFQEERDKDTEPGTNGSGPEAGIRRISGSKSTLGK